MKIITDYDGSSIEVESYNKETNNIELSLRRENGEYSQYYNFFVENKEDKEGIIHIHNIKLSKYYEKDSIYLPYFKVNDKWERISKEQFEVKDNELIIKIKPLQNGEISLVPRYTQNDLDKFTEKLKKYDFIKVYNEILTKIEIGKSTNPTIFVIGRQHPGETLSSFFIEGMIQSIIENKLYEKNHFVIYPIVNTVGVKEGCHRYVNGVDFNRSWNVTNPPKEIQYLKKELASYKVKYFIDVHNDEITPMDYIRANGKFNYEQIADLKVLKSMSPLYRLIRGFVKQRKIVDIHSKTAREYVRKKYKCTSILIELSMNSEDDICRNKGYNFIFELLKR